MDIEELLQIEIHGWQSLCDGSGAQVYGDLMTADGVMILANGSVMTRHQVVEALAAAPVWDDYRIEEPRLIQIGADAAVLVYRGVASRTADAEPFEAMMASTYLRTAHGVRLAVYQQTSTQH
ncbi:nuclear transport factor 2 family protein [Microbacterium aerolatum]|uniref:DUF4440 domain-containing protein n=1 Tax=Microbacterium aerolatum TaxID=153731 RepID=A0A511A9J2_9MICO|nr:nuclear transport factor 2 family protein [Microbacterium aerolatum]GEK84859.1 hypothetical protein MAE01_00350 [Microbacterium aerolatum]GGB36764.1 hypothetical protein GCM10007198_29160 [Microbacterium aerolatum]